MLGSRIALDTNAYSDFQRRLRWQAAIDQAHQVIFPFVVVAELHAGFEGGSNGAENLAVLSQFLSAPEVSVVYPDSTTLPIYGSLFVSLRNRGRPTPTNDIWIAALCLQHNLTLATSDEHFMHFDALLLLPESK